MLTRKLIYAAALSAALATPPLRDADAEMSSFTVKPGLNSNVSAVFDALIGERIIAVSSDVECSLEVDEENLIGKAACSVPLTTLQVDSNETKTQHFQEWATNKKSKPADCTLDIEVAEIKLPPPVEAKKPVTFATEGVFRICGRTRDDGKPEQLTGSIVYLPAGTYGKSRTLRIRARVDSFDREAYGISPAATAGWLARVQQLADVVATHGTIEVNLFATSPATDPAGKNLE